MNNNEIVERLKKDHLCLAEFCRRINIGLLKSQSRHKIFNYIDYFWENHFRPHMLAEDEIFLTVSSNQHLEIAIQQHRLIESNMMSVLTDKSVKLERLSGYTDLIMNHLIFEEREIFPFIAESLTNWQVRIIEWQLVGFQIGLRNDSYQDEFWLCD